jgi:hypothetical protein
MGSGFCQNDQVEAFGFKFQTALRDPLVRVRFALSAAATPRRQKVALR